MKSPWELKHTESYWDGVSEDRWNSDNIYPKTRTVVYMRGQLTFLQFSSKVIKIENNL